MSSSAKNNEKKISIVQDDRFSKVHNDPRFRSVPKKVKKVAIDKRFKSMMDDEKFKMVPKMDKYGRKTKSTGKNKELDRHYYFEDDESKPIKSQKDNEASDEEANMNVEDEENQGFVWNEVSSEEDADEIFNQAQKSENLIEFWNEDAEEIPEAEEETHRLALMNMDWDHVTAEDLMALFTSFCKGTYFIKKVEIYPSEYGLQNMQNDVLYGPKDLWKDEFMNKKNDEDEIIHDRFIDVDEEETRVKGYNESKLREYELNKLKYFYAVIYCNSKEAATYIYNECDGLEYEQSALKLDLRYVPDSLKEFPFAPREACSEVSANYEAKKFMNRALQHTKVHLTWDQTDPKRYDTINRKLATNQLTDHDLKQYIAMSSSSEEEGSDNEQKMEEKENGEDDEDEKLKYKRLLLGNKADENIGADSEDENTMALLKKIKKKYSNQTKKQSEFSQAKDEGEDIEISFKGGFSNIGTQILQKKKEKEERNNETVWEARMRRQNERKAEKKNIRKQEGEEVYKGVKGNKRVAVTRDDDDFQEDEEEGFGNTNRKKEKKNRKKKKRLPEVIDPTTSLLIDTDSIEKKKNFKLNLDDKRFDAIHQDSRYAVDPTSKEFRSNRSEGILNEQQKRRKSRYEQ